jgi:antitoxin component HigA of HigAB toxin-antitoxin module
MKGSQISKWVEEHRNEIEPFFKEYGFWETTDKFKIGMQALQSGLENWGHNRRHCISETGSRAMETRIANKRAQIETIKAQNNQLRIEIQAIKNTRIVVTPLAHGFTITAEEGS